MTLTLVLRTLLYNPLFYCCFLIPMTLLFLDLLTGVGAAIRTRQFSGKQLANFLGNGALKFLGGAGISVVLLFFFGPNILVSGMTLLGMGTLAGTVCVSIASNIQEILSGVPEATPILQTLIPVLAHMVQAVANPTTASGQAALQDLEALEKQVTGVMKAIPSNQTSFPTHL